MNVTVADLRRLLDGAQDDSTLLMVAGRFEIVPAAGIEEYPGALVVISRAALRAQLPRDRAPTDEELRLRAEILSTGITKLGA
jgi:hypothetical protein